MDFYNVTDEDYNKASLALKLDTDFDKDYVKDLIIASRLSLKSRIGSDDNFYDEEDIKPIFRLTVLCMVHDRYFYPGSVSDDEIFDISDSLDGYTMDLKARYAVYSKKKQEVKDDGNT